MYLEKWNDAFYELIGFKVTFGYLFLRVQFFFFYLFMSKLIVHLLIDFVWFYIS